jgi:hypothetical protein
MHGPINVKSPKNISKWQVGFNSAFKGLRRQTGYPKYRFFTSPYVRVSKGAAPSTVTASFLIPYYLFYIKLESGMF